MSGIANETCPTGKMSSTLSQMGTIMKAKMAKPSSSAESLRCRVPGCDADIVGEGLTSIKVLICKTHRSALSVDISGQPHRYCQQCVRMHSIEEFDGKKRGCRVRLQRHNQRRKRTVAAMKRLEQNSSKILAKEPSDESAERAGSYCGNATLSQLLGLSREVKEVSDSGSGTHSIKNSQDNGSGQHCWWNEVPAFLGDQAPPFKIARTSLQPVTEAFLNWQPDSSGPSAVGLPSHEDAMDRSRRRSEGERIVPCMETCIVPDFMVADTSPSRQSAGPEIDELWNSMPNHVGWSCAPRTAAGQRDLWENPHRPLQYHGPRSFNVSMKLMETTPEIFEETELGEVLTSFLQARPTGIEGAMKPGCVHLSVDLWMGSENERAAAAEGYARRFLQGAGRDSRLPWNRTDADVHLPDAILQFRNCGSSVAVLPRDIGAEPRIEGLPAAVASSSSAVSLTIANLPSDCSVEILCRLNGFFHAVEVLAMGPDAGNGKRRAVIRLPEPASGLAWLELAPQGGLSVGKPAPVLVVHEEPLASDICRADSGPWRLEEPMREAFLKDLSDCFGDLTDCSGFGCFARAASLAARLGLGATLEEIVNCALDSGLSLRGVLSSLEPGAGAGLLREAVRSGDARTVKVILVLMEEAGLPWRICELDPLTGLSTLHVAAAYASEEIIGLLLGAGGQEALHAWDSLAAASGGVLPRKVLWERRRRAAAGVSPAGGEAGEPSEPSCCGGGDGSEPEGSFWSACSPMTLPDSRGGEPTEEEEEGPLPGQRAVGWLLGTRGLLVSFAVFGAIAAGYHQRWGVLPAGAFVLAAVSSLTFVVPLVYHHVFARGLRAVRDAGAACGVAVGADVAPADPAIAAQYSDHLAGQLKARDHLLFALALFMNAEATLPGAGAAAAGVWALALIAARLWLARRRTIGGVEWVNAAADLFLTLLHALSLPQRLASLGTGGEGSGLAMVMALATMAMQPAMLGVFVPAPVRAMLLLRAASMVAHTAALARSETAAAVLGAVPAGAWAVSLVASLLGGALYAAIRLSTEQHRLLGFMKATRTKADDPLPSAALPSLLPPLTSPS
eukprot:CAMPEP_0177604170 /NCGR_PEP_ID=MMETSP0419_2-20121207/15964_1 /TAXON_ID=582737 /ORGANISM="Tetraselmis sp., Strain GSL018" /LENGTH=1071 /DNA_ID=CAMNT_0019098113 /DNA_START=279 /DNA_END=3491 /DNA_ORIENTATION=-